MATKPLLGDSKHPRPIPLHAPAVSYTAEEIARLIEEQNKKRREAD